MGYHNREAFAPIDHLSGKEERLSKSAPTNAEKWKYTLCTTLLFVLISSPMLYNFTTSVSGLTLSTGDGAPTPLGQVVHSLVFTLLLRAMMG